MIWFLASKFLIFPILLAANRATAEEFQIQQPSAMISAEHSAVTTDIGRMTSCPSSKPLLGGIHPRFSPYVFKLLIP